MVRIEGTRIQIRNEEKVKLVKLRPERLKPKKVEIAEIGIER